MSPLILVVLEVGAPAALRPTKKAPGSVDEGAGLVTWRRGQCQKPEHRVCVNPADRLKGFRVWDRRQQRRVPGCGDGFRASACEGEHCPYGTAAHVGTSSFYISPGKPRTTRLSRGYCMHTQDRQPATSCSPSVPTTFAEAAGRHEWQKDPSLPSWLHMNESAVDDDC